MSIYRLLIIFSASGFPVIIKFQPATCNLQKIPAVQVRLTFGSREGVSQIRIRVRQMIFMDQFEVFRCANLSIMAAQRSQTSRFCVGFSGGNSEQTVKQPKEVFSRKHRAHCLKAVPGCW